MADQIGPVLVKQTSLTGQDATAQEKLGTRMQVNNKGYVYVQCRSAIAVGQVLGTLSSASGQSSYKVTGIIANCSVKKPAGVALATASAGSYVWLQYKGYTTHVKTDGSIGATSILAWLTNKVAKCATAAHISGRHFGYSRAADSGSVAVSAHLECLDGL